MNLGVNIDHIATVRQARRGFRPDPVAAALIAEQNGAWGITAHLREDRRHIQDIDIERLAKTVRCLNMEMGATKEMVSIALKVSPHSCCLVPEKREELTTEGGLNVVESEKRLYEMIARLHEGGIVVSLFIDPELEQVEAAARIGADYIELHTGRYAQLTAFPLESDDNERLILSSEVMEEIHRLSEAAEMGHRLGLKVNAGHGIDYQNIDGILRIPHLRELNIGYSIVSRALFTGLPEAVRTMTSLVERYAL